MTITSLPTLINGGCGLQQVTNGCYVFVFTILQSSNLQMAFPAEHYYWKNCLWYLGINTQHWINFFVNTETFNFTVDQPTCATIALDSTNQNISGNKINLGDHYVSCVKQDVSRVVPFSIRGDYCYANKITVKLKATTAAPNKKLIGKSSGSATGVGVKIYSTTNNVQLYADNSNEIIFNYANWSNHILYFPFTAQLVKDGGNGTISPGILLVTRHSLFPMNK